MWAVICVLPSVTPLSFPDVICRESAGMKKLHPVIVYLKALLKEFIYRLASQSKKFRGGEDLLIFICPRFVGCDLFVILLRLKKHSR